MEAQLDRYAVPQHILQVQAAAVVPNARASPKNADAAFTVLNGTAVTILAGLVCGLVAALALHVVLRCALRVVTRGVCRDDEDGHQLHDTREHASRHGSRKNKRNPRRSALVQALPCLAYVAGLDLAGSSRRECAICLAEFARGDKVRVLPRCNHGFHARCVDR